MAKNKWVINFSLEFFDFVYVYSGSSTKTRFKYVKAQNIFTKVTSIDEVMIVLHKCDLNPEIFFLPLKYFLPVLSKLYLST